MSKFLLVRPLLRMGCYTDRPADPARVLWPLARSFPLVYFHPTLTHIASGLGERGKDLPEDRGSQVQVGTVCCLPLLHCYTMSLCLQRRFVCVTADSKDAAATMAKSVLVRLMAVHDNL